MKPARRSPLAFSAPLTGSQRRTLMMVVAVVGGLHVVGFLFLFAGPGKRPPYHHAPLPPR